MRKRGRVGKVFNRCLTQPRAQRPNDPKALARGARYRFNKIRCRRLPVRSRDANDGQARTWIAVKPRSNFGERGERVRYDDARGARCRKVVVGDDGESAGLERSLHKRVSVGALATQAKKQCARPQLARIRRKRGDRQPRISLDRYRYPLEEAFEGLCCGRLHQS